MKTIVLALFSMTALCACAGGRANLRFDDTQYPVSLSPTVLGSDGAVLAPDRREVVGELALKFKVWGIFWAVVPLTPNKDLSTQINERIAEVGGQAVVNLRVTSRQCGMNHAWVVSTVPLWPGCSIVLVEGDIIREVRPEAAASGSPAPREADTSMASAVAGL